MLQIPKYSECPLPHHQSSSNFATARCSACPRLATQFLRLSSNPKAHPGSFPPMPWLSRASTQLGSTSHPVYLFISPPQHWSWKVQAQRRDWLWSTKEPVFFCLLVLPPCPVTTRLSFLLCWLWEELLDKSHASKCLPLVTTWATWRSSGLIKAHIHCFNPTVRGQHRTRLKEFVICKHSVKTDKQREAG